MASVWRSDCDEHVDEHIIRHVHVDDHSNANTHDHCDGNGNFYAVIDVDCNAAYYGHGNGHSYGNLNGSAGVLDSGHHCHPQHPAAVHETA